MDDIGKATVTIENKLETNKYEVLNDNQIRLYDYIDRPEVVNKTLVINDVMVSSIHQTGMNLENYFIELIGGSHNA